MFDKEMRDSRAMTDGTVFDSTASVLTRVSLAVAAVGALLGLVLNSGAALPTAGPVAAVAPVAVTAVAG